MSDLPKISVITASFNQGQYIEETIYSVVNQRYPNVEHIVIDGGSTDETVEVLKRNERHLAYWVSEKDRGQTHAINKGLEKATGDLVIVLNSDDTMLSGAFDAIAKAFAEHPDWRWLTAPSLLFGSGAYADFQFPILPKERADWLVRISVSHPSTVLRREVYEKHGPYDEGMYFCMDHEYWLRLIMNGEKCHEIARPLSTFRIHDDCKSVKATDRKEADHKTLFERYSKMLTPAERQGLEQKIAKRKVRDLFWDAQNLLRSGRKAEARRAFREACKSGTIRFRIRAFYTTWLRLHVGR